MRGLASPHPFSGAFLAILFGVFVLPERTVLDSSGSGYASVLCALLGSTADAVHVSIWWLLVTFSHISV